MMPDLAGAFASGRIIDAILLVMAAEGAWLVGKRRRPAGDVVFTLLPGALILLGLRAALTGAGWPMVALWLALSFPAHLEDVRRRCR